MAHTEEAFNLYAANHMGSHYYNLMAENEIR